jgi:hypothetical protein
MDGKEYEERKKLLEDMKRLVKSEQEAIFRILKAEKAEYSENSNGIFFDVSKLSTPLFMKLREYMEFCRKNRDDFTQREEEERKAQELINSGAGTSV